MSTIVADHIESLLQEIEFASQCIANVTSDRSAPDDVERTLIDALETARRLLEGALNRAEQHGVPKMAINAA